MVSESVNYLKMKARNKLKKCLIIWNIHSQKDYGAFLYKCVMSELNWCVIGDSDTSSELNIDSLKLIIFLLMLKMIIKLDSAYI